MNKATENTQGMNAANEEYSLNDDRRVKVLTPGALVAKRFFRNKLAIVGLGMLIAMFVFSFVGGIITPYGQDEIFRDYTMMAKEYVGVTRNEALRYASAEDFKFSSLDQAQFILALNTGKTDFSGAENAYSFVDEGGEVYSIYSNSKLVAMAYKDIVFAADNQPEQSFQVKHDALVAYVTGEESFTVDGAEYTLDSDGNISSGGTELAYISRFVVQSKENGVVITRDFKERLEESLESGGNDFVYTDPATGEEHNYAVSYDAGAKVWSVTQETATYVSVKYGRPSAAHPLGTDGNGMDMLTRLMYGGRVSLIIGFIVVGIETVLGVIFGGISGYFGGWVDNLIMRIVDIFYCIPSMPIIIILGATMDSMQVDPQIRMLYLMLLLGFLGWPSIARMVRGQILSLREQEFMTATEACGISIGHRIFKHLIPNVIPQLIVICTMSLGSVIITEATLSFLGLGVKFPFASWGNIISDVNNSFVMTNYWFIWIPAGICLLITVLGFNFVGDGLRDAFDPKMKR